ncbi:hypothetical protein AB6N24_05960 [Cellulomonas sp. 179-A 4D5 NHS]|uniref:hypothetical protein n=1 Tax=Cellulomonas sp. 179-A 4D5 NHS TaxID=3142378 RepID=UPI00399EF880
MARRGMVVALAAVLVAAVPTPPATAGLPGPRPVWSIEALSAPSQQHAVARDVNSSGQVAGWVNGDTVPHAVVWQPDGSMTLFPDDRYPSSSATGINELGQVVGTGGGMYTAIRPFVWDVATGQVTWLGALGTGNAAYGQAINDAGQVVGHSRLQTEGPARAFLWDPATGRMDDLGTLGGTTSEAHGINDAGQVVGQAMREDQRWRAFVWDPGTGVMTDLGAVREDGQSWAADINDAGDVVGTSTVETGSAGFLWSVRTGRMTAVPGMAWATGINERGDVAGWQVTETGYEAAAVWPRSRGSVVRLPALGTEQPPHIGPGGWSSPGDISDEGVVAGRA